MVDELVRRGIEGASVLEVGGGVGAVEIELLEAGAARAANVELSDGYEEEAARLLAEKGLAGRVRRTLGDFARRAGDTEPAAEPGSVSLVRVEALLGEIFGIPHHLHDVHRA